LADLSRGPPDTLRTTTIVGLSDDSITIPPIGKVRPKKQKAENDDEIAQQVR